MFLNWLLPERFKAPSLYDPADENRRLVDHLNRVNRLLTQEKELAVESLCREESDLMWGFFYGLAFAKMAMEGHEAKTIIGQMPNPELRRLIKENHRNKSGQSRND